MILLDHSHLVHIVGTSEPQWWQQQLFTPRSAALSMVDDQGAELLLPDCSRFQVPRVSMSLFSFRLMVCGGSLGQGQGRHHWLVPGSLQL